MSAHTPGPWDTREARDGSGDVGITAHGVKNVIAECFADMRFAGEGNKREAAANARLIAAAPDLLEALKDVRFMLYGEGPGNPKVDAAIARAEGRT